MFFLLRVVGVLLVSVAVVALVDIFSVRMFCCKAELTPTLQRHRTM
jgi:hypothetical protein